MADVGISVLKRQSCGQHFYYCSSHCPHSSCESLEIDGQLLVLLPMYLVSVISQALEFLHFSREVPGSKFGFHPAVTMTTTPF